MTTKNSRRVVIINNIRSDMIEQAIFILKSNEKRQVEKHMDSGIIVEAQNIIENYIKQVENGKAPEKPLGKRMKRRRRKRQIAFIALSAAALMAACYGAVQLMSFIAV